VLGGHLPELLIVLVLALVVFGPKRLPEIGGSLGKGIREFKKSTTELQDSMNVQDKTSTVTVPTPVASPVPPTEVRPVPVVHEPEGSPMPSPVSSTSDRTSV